MRGEVMRNKYLVHWTYIGNHSGAPFLVNAGSAIEAAKAVALGMSPDFQARGVLHVHCVHRDASASGFGCTDFVGQYTCVKNGAEFSPGRIFEIG